MIVVTFAAALEMPVADSSDSLSQHLVSLSYLNGFPPSLGADHFTLPLLGLEPEGLDAEVFLEGNSSALWPFPPHFSNKT